MAYDLQKRVKKEIDKIYPRKKNDWKHNMERCKLNAIKLQEGARKKK